MNPAVDILAAFGIRGWLYHLSESDCSSVESLHEFHSLSRVPDYCKYVHAYHSGAEVSATTPSNGFLTVPSGLVSDQRCFIVNVIHQLARRWPCIPVVLHTSGRQDVSSAVPHDTVVGRETSVSERNVVSVMALQQQRATVLQTLPHAIHS